MNGTGTGPPVLSTSQDAKSLSGWPHSQSCSSSARASASMDRDAQGHVYPDLPLGLCAGSADGG